MERNHTPQFSVVIPVFNRPRLVAEAIESVFAQSYKNLELLLIDDGSTDETPEVLKRYGAEARIIRQPRKGPGSARNRGLESARGNYVAFLDSDDVWFAWTLATFQWVIQRTGAPTIV